MWDKLKKIIIVLENDESETASELNMTFNSV